MAKGRMIHTKLWDSEQFLSLAAWERLLYIALIVLADDEGCFRADSGYWQRKIFYGQKTGKTQIERMIQTIQETGLIVTGKAEKGFAGFHPNWFAYQTLTKAKSKPSAFSDLLIANGRMPRFTPSSQGNLGEEEVNVVESNPSHDERSESRPSLKELFNGPASYKRESILNGIPENKRDQFQRPSPKDFDG